MHTILKSVLARTLALAVAFIAGSALADLSPVLEITASQLKSAAWSDAGVATIGNWTISLNGNTLNDDGTISISQTATAGVTIHFPAAVSQYTAAIKYSGYQKAATNYTALLDFKNSSSAYVGALDSNGARAFYAGMVYTSFDNQIVGSSNNPTINESGVMAISYKTGGSGLGFFIDNNERTALVATRRAGITWSSSTISDFVIGGLISGQSHALINYPTSLTISDIAIFSDYAITADDAQAFSDYKFLSERTFDTELYEPFLENFSDRIMTITSLGNAADAKDLGSNNGTFALFDPTTGMDTLTQFLGGTDTQRLPDCTDNTLAWRGFCKGQTGYTNPGLVMRFAPYVAGRSVVVGGAFSPLNLGGLIVEEGASSGQTIPALQQGGARATTFGDMRTEGAVPTFFILKDSFKINRNGATTICGDATFDIAEGKSFVCNTNNASQPVTLQSGAIFRAVGGGTFTVATLTATGAVTLDYSAQALERLTGDTPFIDGTLAVDEGTTIILPADAQPSVAYKLATTISGDTIAALKLGEEDIPDGATIVLNELNGTVSYIEGKCEQDIEGKVDYSKIEWSKTPTAIDLATLNAADGTELTFDTAAEFMQLDIIAAGDLTLNVNNALAHPVAVKLQEGVESATITLTKGGDGSLATPISVVAGCKVVIGAGATLADLGSCTVVLSATDSCTLTSAPLQTFVGEGSLVFDGVIPSAAQRTIFQDSTQWTGTVWLKNLSLINADFDMDNYGNASSKIKLTGITGYAAQASNPTAVDCVSEVELVDEGEILAVALNDGYSSSGGNTCTYTFAKITGAGTFKNSGGSCSPQYRFVDVADFTGTLWVASNMRFVIGEGTGFGDSQKITIDGDTEIACTLLSNVVNKAAVTLKGGKTLTIAAGDEGTVEVVDGTLRLTLTTAQAVSGYTADGVTLPQGQNIVFVKPDGTEIVGEGNAFGGDGVLWTGAAMDSLWSSPNNWSNQKTPTADTEVSIKQDAEIILREGDACSNLVLNANVTLKGDVSSLGTTSVGEGCALTFNVANDAEMIVSNAINGAGAVIKSGEGTLTLTQTSSYAGGTTVEQGGLVFGPNDCPIGPYEQNATVWTTNAVVKSGAWLDLNGRWDQTYVILLEADASLLNNGADIGTGVRQTKMIALGGNATVGGTGAFGIHNAGNVQSKLELGEYTLTKMGTNAFDLVNTTINGTGTIAIEEGSLRTYTTSSTAANATLTFAEGTSANIGANANLTVKNLVLNGAPINGVGVLTATGVIGGEQTLVKRGNGTLRLNAVNTYTGGTVVEQGTLQLGNYQALGGGTAEQKVVRVWRGGAVDTLDANGVNDAYSLIFADAGEGATAKLLKSTTANPGVGKTYPIRYLSLEADGEIALPNAASGFGLVGQGFTATTIALSTNTLAKTGAGQFILCNTIIDGTGTIDVRAGELAVFHADTTAAEATLNLAAGATLNLGAGGNVGSLTVRNMTGSGTITGGGTVTVTGTMDASYASSENVVPSSDSTMLISDPSGCPVEITKVPLSGVLFVDLADAVAEALASNPVGTQIAKFSPDLASCIKLSDHAKQAFKALGLRLAKGTDADGSVVFVTAKPSGFHLILR